jgi:hypothetical protein
MLYFANCKIILLLYLIIKVSKYIKHFYYKLTYKNKAKKLLTILVLNY